MPSCAQLQLQLQLRPQLRALAEPAGGQVFGAAFRFQKSLLLQSGWRDGSWFCSKQSYVPMFAMVDCFWHARLRFSPGQPRTCVQTINSGWWGPGWGGPRPLGAIRVGSPCAWPLWACAEVLAVHFQEKRINKTQGSVGLAALQLRRRPGFYRMHSIYKAELTQGGRADAG